MNQKLSMAARGPAAALAGCVGGGSVTEDWTEDSRTAARSGLASMVDGIIQVVKRAALDGVASASPARGS